MESLPGKTCGIVNKRSKIFSSQKPGPQVLTWLFAVQHVLVSGNFKSWAARVSRFFGTTSSLNSQRRMPSILHLLLRLIARYVYRDQKSSFPQKQRLSQSPVDPKSGYSGDKQFARNSSTSKDASLSRRVLLVPRCTRSVWVLKAMSYVDSFLQLFNQM